MHGAHEVVGSNPAGPTSGSLPRGVLPLQHLRQLATEGGIIAPGGVDALHFQPASLDLRLGKYAWQVRAGFLPGPDATVRQRMRSLRMNRIDLTEGAVLAIGGVYVVRLQEGLHLPKGVWGVANAKSTTGRLDVFTRLIADYSSEFDRLPLGYRGPLYAEISPRTFSLLVRRGSRLNQIRLSRGNPVISGHRLQNLHDTTPLVDAQAEIDAEGLRFSVDIDGHAGRLTGWRAKRHSRKIDIDKTGAYAVKDFWDPVYGENGGLVLEPGAFYILAAREAVRIPPDYAAEMTPYLPSVGEFRVHYAGFFDPGFGFGLDNDRGARSVLEVRCHETPFILRHGQVVGRLVFEDMLEAPELVYGKGSGANYQGQGLQLARQFKRPSALGRQVAEQVKPASSVKELEASSRRRAQQPQLFPDVKE